MTNPNCIVYRIKTKVSWSIPLTPSEVISILYCGIANTVSGTNLLQLTKNTNLFIACSRCVLLNLVLPENESMYELIDESQEVHCHSKTGSNEGGRG